MSLPGGYKVDDQVFCTKDITNKANITLVRRGQQGTVMGLKPSEGPFCNELGDLVVFFSGTSSLPNGSERVRRVTLFHEEVRRQSCGF